MKDTKASVLDIEDAQLRRNAAALLASKIGVFEYEPATEVAFWDDRVRELWGISEDVEVTYHGVILPHIHPDDQTYHDESTARALDPEGDGHLDITYRLFPRGDDQPMRRIRAIADCKFEGKTPIRLVGTVEDVTTQKLAEEKTTFLLGELQHRLKNTLAIVSAVINRSRVGHVSIDDYAAALDARVKALADSHKVLSKGNWESVCFKDIVISVFHDFFRNTDRIKIAAGPKIMIPEQNVLIVSLAVYELMSNALKHGALSVDSGYIALTTNILDDTTVIRWTEMDGPDVPAGTFPPSGFGSFLLNKVVAAELDASVTYESQGKGAIFELKSTHLEEVSQ